MLTKFNLKRALNLTRFFFNVLNYLEQLPQRLQPQLLQPQLLHPQLLLLIRLPLDKVSSKSNKKFVLLFKSVLVADAKIESSRTSKTLLEKFIISLHFTKFDIIN